MIKLSFILKLRTLNNLPALERWYNRYRAPEAISCIGPWITCYLSYWAVPPPPEAEHYGFYDYHFREVWLRSAEDQILALDKGIQSFTWLPNQREMMREIGVGPYTTKWVGRPGRPHPPVKYNVPARRTEDILGGQLTPDEKTILRWYIAMKYPDGVPVEEGEKWYLNIHSKEIMRQPGLTRFKESRRLTSERCYC